VAARLARLRKEGNEIIVVVSAMGDTTDDLLALASEITDNPHRRELDMLLTAGERISMALLSMALNALDCPAISFTGSQSGIITDSGHGHAKIKDVRPVRIREELNGGRVVIVAGFQGVSPEKEVTTLGRGGSDTSAVALAVAFKAAECAIYTDVDGVMTADPRIVPGARRLDRLDFDTMLEFSSRGAGVINFRAVELARAYRMPLAILNSLRSAPGTRIDGEIGMEKKGIAGVTANDRVVGIQIEGLKIETGGMSPFVGWLSGLGLDISGLHQYTDSSGQAGFSFTVNERPGHPAGLSKLEEEVKTRGGRLARDESLGAVSVVGYGVIDPLAVAARCLEVLAGVGIAPRSFLSGTLSMTFVVPRAEVARAVKTLHDTLVA